MMTKKVVNITARDTGERTTASLIICPECKSETFLCYTPAGMDHLHLQCVSCGTTFCEGCTK